MKLYRKLKAWARWHLKTKPAYDFEELRLCGLDDPLEASWQLALLRIARKLRLPIEIYLTPKGNHWSDWTEKES